MQRPVSSSNGAGDSRGQSDDESRRQHAEEALGASEQRYRQLLAAVTTYTYSVEIQNGTPVSTEHSWGCVSATGYSPQDYAADPNLWISMVHADDREMVRQHVANVLACQRVPAVEHRILHKDGTVRWVRDTIVCHRDDAGRLVGYDGLVEDVTERKRVEDRFRRLLESAPDAMVIADQDGRIILINEQTEKMFGYGREQLLGQPVEVLIPERFRSRHPEHFASYVANPHVRSLGTGQDLRGVRKDGSEFPADVSLSPLETEEGLLVVAAVRDVTEHRRTDEQIQRNLQIQSALSSLLRMLLEPIPLEQQLERALDLLFSIPWIALESKGCIFLAEGDPEVLVMKGHRGLSDDMLAGCARVPFGQCLCGQAAATGRIVFADCVDGRHEARYSQMSPHGHYCVPIMSGDRLHGVINVYVKEGHRQEPQEETFLRAVADALAGAVELKRAEETLRENAAQLLAAQRVQEQLLPHAPPGLPGFDIHGAMCPAEFTAGDYFDYLAMPNECVGFVIGDVSGHGLGPALLMASTHGLLRSLAQTQTDISQMLCRANRFLSDETKDGRFVTLLLARLDPGTRRLVYANAGHPPGYVLDCSGRVKAELESQSLPLGILPEAEFPTGGPVVLEPGDLLLLLTDGIFEAAARDGRMFGTRRALDIVAAHCDRPAAEIVEALFRAVREFSGTENPKDDLTAVVIKVEPGGETT